MSLVSIVSIVSLVGLVGIVGYLLDSIEMLNFTRMPYTQNEVTFQK